MKPAKYLYGSASRIPACRQAGLVSKNSLFKTLLPKIYFDI